MFGMIFKALSKSSNPGSDGGGRRLLWSGMLVALLVGLGPVAGAVAAPAKANPPKNTAAVAAEAPAPLGKSPIPEGAFRVEARAAILGDIDTGAILFEQNADERLDPASLTKVMTLYLVYEALAKGRLRLDEMLLVSEEAWRMEGSKTFVKVGDRIKLEDLILGIAVQSGNDACHVVAEHMGGSDAGFSQMMNVKAKSLGLTGTHFTNSTGLPDPDHYTTARDMFRLAQAIIRDFPQYAHYVKIKEYTFNGITQHNRNNLLWKDPSITGLKTGHTNAAGFCLIATNEKDEQRLAAVVMGTSGTKVREEEALRLLRFGNRNFETLKLFGAGHKVRNVRVWKGEEREATAILDKQVQVTIPRREKDKLEVGFVYQDPIIAPIRAGENLGAVVVRLGEKELARYPVVSDRAVAEGGFFASMVDAVRLKLGW